MENNFCLKCMEKLPNGAEFCPNCGQKVGETEVNPIALPPKTVLRGRYLIGSVLGQGGFGITYVGYDLLLEMRVAIKEYFPAGMSSRSGESIQWHGTEQQKEQGLDGFMKEARKMAKLDEIPSIVGVRDVFHENGTAYIVMKYIEGETLKSKIKREGKMSPDVCVSLLMPIMEDLCQVHDAGILHRDIKPDNIMITPSGKAMLLDLGAAKELTAPQMEDGKSLSSNYIVSHGFSPIEQYTAAGKVGAWTDVYSLCATLFYAVTGEVPPTAIERLSGDKDVELPDNLPEKFVKILKKGLAIQPTQRTQTVRELISELKGNSVPEAPKAEVNKPSEKSSQIKEAKPKKKSGLTAIIVFAFLIVLGIVAYPSAKEAYVSSCVNIAVKYENGDGVEQDYEIALEWYKKAADNGNTDAMYSIGCMFADGHGVEQDYAKAMEWYRNAADNGNADAMNSIGYMYDCGNGVEQDYEKALEWYEKAIDAGNVDSMYNIGSMYEYGNGVEQDYTKAMECYTKAASNGNASAMNNIGYLYACGNGVVQNYTKAIEWYAKSADSGNAEGMFDLGYMYDYGLGVEQDYEKAMSWYKKAADAGNTAAMNNIGTLYYNAFGVELDYEKAMQWFEKAANGGNASAMSWIGYMYDYGLDVEQDYEKAMKWYKKAADGGIAAAMYNIGHMYDRGRGVEQDYEEAMKWYKKAADGGNATAMHNIGYMYERGKGVPQSSTTAKEWYAKAEAAGYTE